MGAVVGARVVDAFAGSGALGIEALSRGAAHCTFIEQDRAALAVLQRNLATLGLESRSTVLRGDAVALAGGISADLVMVDPPYEFGQWAKLMGQLTAALVVAESDRPLDAEDPPITGWEVVRVKRYGRAFVSFLKRLA
jgi:16S rRNA (guanine966-N2)-methyltransferase